MNIIRTRRFKTAIVAGLLALALPIAVACGGPGASEAEFRVNAGNIEWRPDADSPWETLATGTEISGIVTIDPALIMQFTATIEGLGAQVLALQTQLEMLQAGGAGGGGATLNVTDSNGRVGFVELLTQDDTVITASGAGFPPSQSVTLTCGGEQLASVMTDANGAVFFGEEIVLPSNIFDAEADGSPNAYGCVAAAGGVMSTAVLNVEDKQFN